MMTFKVDILNSENEHIATLVVPSKTNLLVSFMKKKFNIDHTCDGNATCGTCRFIVLNGECSKMTQIEREFFEERGRLENERLSCQAIPKSDLLIKI